MKGDFCFRCGTAFKEDDWYWVQSEQFEDYLSIDCPNCGHGYSKGSKRPLLEFVTRKGIFALPMYNIARCGYERASEQIPHLSNAIAKGHDIRYLRVFIKEIEDELINPSFTISEILPWELTEEQGRTYMSKVLVEIRRILSEESN